MRNAAELSIFEFYFTNCISIKSSRCSLSDSSEKSVFISKILYFRRISVQCTFLRILCVTCFFCSALLNFCQNSSEKCFLESPAPLASRFTVSDTFAFKTDNSAYCILFLCRSNFVPTVYIFLECIHSALCSLSSTFPIFMITVLFELLG